jgi:hypothetical protein
LEQPHIKNTQVKKKAPREKEVRKPGRRTDNTIAVQRCCSTILQCSAGSGAKQKIISSVMFIIYQESGKKSSVFAKFINVLVRFIGL